TSARRRCRRTAASSRSSFISITPEASAFRAGRAEESLGHPSIRSRALHLSYNARVRAIGVDYGSSCSPGAGGVGNAWRGGLSAAAGGGDWGGDPGGGGQ